MTRIIIRSGLGNPPDSPSKNRTRRITFLHHELDDIRVVIRPAGDKASRLPSRIRGSPNPDNVSANHNRRKSRANPERSPRERVVHAHRCLSNRPLRYLIFKKELLEQKRRSDGTSPTIIVRLNVFCRALCAV